METVLKELTNLSSSGVLRAIEEYTKWYLVSAIGWFVVGIVFVIGGCIIGQTKLGPQDSNKSDFEECWNDWMRYGAMIFVVFIGIAMIIYNLSTICAPEAYAIYHFIQDIKP
ncbi:hypothetical protein LCGC14_1316990 [marine sediment metagenome]|uniref:Transmembrane protein n=1 Tax=marine sediment metagenome TaxID=412755 RepID=A0A0F9NMV9_9ZZZZ